MDRRTEKASYRVACPQLKKERKKKKEKKEKKKERRNEREKENKNRGWRTRRRKLNGKKTTISQIPALQIVRVSRKKKTF